MGIGCVIHATIFRPTKIERPQILSYWSVKQCSALSYLLWDSRVLGPILGRKREKVQDLKKRKKERAFNIETVQQQLIRYAVCYD